jgi:hypothetical protein
MAVDTTNWTRENLAWLAGLLEGDGCFTVGSSQGLLRLECAMSDLDVLQKAQDIAGTGNISGPYNYGIGSKAMYRWHVTTTKNAYALMVALYPWLGNRRKNRILDLLESFRVYGIKLSKPTKCPQDHLYLSENTYITSNGSNGCRECRRESVRRSRLRRMEKINGNS